MIVLDTVVADLYLRAFILCPPQLFTDKSLSFSAHIFKLSRWPLLPGELLRLGRAMIALLDRNGNAREANTLRLEDKDGRDNDNIFLHGKKKW